MQHRHVSFIGAGNMTRSIISGLIKHGYPADKITASNPSMPKLEALAQDFGIRITQSNHEAVATAEVVVLGVKPQLMETVCTDLAEHCQLDGKLFISIAAGILTDRLKRMLGGDYQLIRTMPNTPSALSKGLTGLYAGEDIAQHDRDFAGALMQHVGEIVWVAKEEDINGVIAAAGSSPAYFFTFLHGMQQEAERMGFDHDTARLMVQQAMLGAAEMVCANPQLELTELTAQVTSKGGTTAKAVEYFLENGINEMVAGAMQAAVRRAGEMEKLF